MTSNSQLQIEFGDATERARVLDPTQSFIVQAPAGSGKTELLMQRYLTLLAHPGVSQPENVLAITFTRKAAAEMRNRVLDALQNASQPAPEAPHKRLSWDLAQRVAARDRELGWAILSNPERLEIRTVDSFCEKIANRTPLLAGFGQSPAIAADFNPLYAEAAQRTLLMLGDADKSNRDAVAYVLRDQDNSFDRVQRLLVELLKRRDHWLRLIGASLERTTAEQEEIRTRLESALHDAVRYELCTLRERILTAAPQNVLEMLLDFARYGAAYVHDTHAIRLLRGVTALPSDQPDQLPLWQALGKFCLTENEEFRKEYNVKTGFPPGPVHKTKKDACNNLIKAISESDYAETFCAALCRVAKLPPAQYSDAQWQSLLSLFRVLPLAVANLRTVFSERGEVDHTEVALAAKAALGEEGRPTDLALHLGYKIQHLLVDEFQDTSVSQTELLEHLIQAWSPESGSTLFVVGDPMQSIYAFRQAEVTLFQRAREHGFASGAWPLEPATLTSNFRSRPALIDWFNEVFPHILIADNDVTGAVKYSPATAEKHSKLSAGVRLHSAPAKDFSAEADRVVAIVREELAGDAKSIAILVRSRIHLAHIAPALADAGIPYRAKEIAVLGERQTVRDLHAITQALLHLADRTAWLTLLRGPWCGLSLADLWELCRGGEDRTIWELLQSRRHSMSARGQQVLERILPVLSTAVAHRGRLPLRTLVESLWISLGGPAALAGTERDAKLRDAETYLALLQKIETVGEVDEQRLESEIEKLYAQPDTASGIRVEIMTIHGAKGLEFDVVILPGLNRRTDRNRTQLLNWRERVIGEHRDLLLAPMEPVGTDIDNATTLSKYITQLEQESAAEESKRLLYVAATRARERLHLVTTMPGHDKKPESGSLLSLLPQSVFARFPMQEDPEIVSESRPRRPNLLRRLPENWTLPASPAPLEFEARDPVESQIEKRKHTFVRVGEDLRRVGTVTHRFLQQIGEEGLESWSTDRILKLAPTVRALLVQEGTREADLVAAERRVREALRNTLSDEHGRWILQKRESSHNEYALSAALEARRQSIKVDRTFVEDQTRWLIDYKTSDQEGTITESYLREQINKYRDDLQRYANILHAFDGVPVKGGLYFPLLQRWCEVDLTP
jgi:ATP-dependent exoDNAse (exonuclease V) beta subunit